MQCHRPPNSCRQCGSTNYHRLFARDGSGVLRHNGSYQCSGCQMNFTRVAEWRGGAFRGNPMFVPDLAPAATNDRSGQAV